jgi:hypothetical protein
MNNFSNLYKKELLYSLVVLLTFFLPWVSWGFISFKGYQIPNMISNYGDLGDLLSVSNFERNNNEIVLAYSIYLIPILTVSSILINLKGKKPSTVLNYLAVYVVFASIYSATIYKSTLLKTADIGIYVIVISTILYSGSLYYDNKKSSTRNKEGEFKIDRFRAN